MMRGLPANGAVDASRPLSLPTLLIRAPAIIGRHKDPEPPRPSSVALEIHRQPLRAAADWQLQIIQEWQGHRDMFTFIATFMRDTRLIQRCVFLASDDVDGPLIFRYIGQPSTLILGEDWKAQNLNRPHFDNPFRALPDCLGDEYAEAIEGGEPLHNLGIAHGLKNEPVRFTHTLIGLQALDKRRAVLSCIQL